MAKAKNVTRTIITGYEYDVLKRDGENLQKVGAVITESPIRSIKQQNEELVKNKYDGQHVLVLKQAVAKQFTMTEEDFISYATEVKEAEIQENQIEE